MIWLVVPAVLLGTVLQRICGTGVGLVVAPLFALAMGGAEGVFMANMTTLVSGTLLTVALHRLVNWREWAWICATGLLGTVPGALLVGALPGPVLQVVVGAVVLLAMAVILRTGQSRPRCGRGVTTLAGASAGLLNVTAGVAAPAVVMYSRVTRWDQREYAATTQPIFMTLAVTSLASKYLVGAVHPNHLPSAWLFLAVAGAVLAGMPLGAVLARRISSERARTMALVLAGLGALMAVVKGIMGMI